MRARRSWAVLACACFALPACASSAATDEEVASSEAPLSQTDAAMIAAAKAIAARCVATGCYRTADGRGSGGLGENETLVLFRAAEIETGVPARLLKAIAYGEGLGDGYVRAKYPRHFYDLSDNPSFATRASWAKQRLGLDVPLTLGIDTANPTYGIGIMQLTARRTLVEAAVAAARGGASAQPVLLYGGGRPYFRWAEDDVVRFDVMRGIEDPYYNIVKAAELIKFKIRVYTDPESPVHWVAKEPKTDMEWALVGSTYQVYGGVGPGGGATTRLYNRMTNGTSPVYRDAYLFVNAQPTLP